MTNILISKYYNNYLELLVVDENLTIIEDVLLKELPIFEQFFLKVGMKRIDGAIYGLLTLAVRPLTSIDIEKTLNLSQSAISTSLSNLTNFGAIESFPGKERRLMRHKAKPDTLQTVATIFRMREQEAVESFKRMATRVSSLDIQNNEDRAKRLESIIEISNLAESVMELVIEISKLSPFKRLIRS